MKVKEIIVKNIITKSNLPDADFVINPYTGCTHSCIYCYARFMKRFTGHDEKWGQFIDVKINGADLVINNIKKITNKSIFMSSVTDPYLPLEKKYKITRNILCKLVEFDPLPIVKTKKWGVFGA
jgi:DNA repair photolyase